MSIAFRAGMAVVDLAAAAQWIGIVLPAAVVGGAVNVWLARSEGRDEERARVRTLLAEAFFLSWTALESADVGAAYGTMVDRLRAVAGELIREAWNSPAITTDAEMNIPSSIVDLDSLASPEREFHNAVDAHLRRLTPCHGR